MNLEPEDDSIARCEPAKLDRMWRAGETRNASLETKAQNVLRYTNEIVSNATSARNDFVATRGRSQKPEM
jgi:hypothetical protein